MTSVPLWSVADMVRETVEPATLGSDVLHYSIPALEQGGEPIVEHAASIKSSKLRLRGGEILVSKLNPRKGRVLLVPELDGPTVASTEFVAFRPGGRMDPRFLTYLMSAESTRQQLAANVRSVTRSHQRVEPEIVARLPVPEMPIQEQRRIADFLDSELTRLREMSSLRCRQVSLVRDRYEADLESNILRGNRPRVPLRRLTKEVVVGIVVRPAQWYSTALGAVPAIRSLDVKPGQLAREGLIRLSPEGHAVHPRSRLRPGDVVIVRTGNAGTAAVVPNDFGPANCIDCMIVRTSSRLVPSFLELIMNSRAFRSQVAAQSVGALQGHFGVETARSMAVPHFDLVEQDALVADLVARRTSIEAMAERTERAIAALFERQQALITAAVTGQIDVTTARGVA